MAEARNRAQWDRTASLLALLVNVNRDPKKTRAAKPADYHPYYRAGRSDVIVVDKDTVGLMREEFLGNAAAKAPGETSEGRAWA